MEPQPRKALAEKAAVHQPERAAAPQRARVAAQRAAAPQVAVPQVAAHQAAREGLPLEAAERPCLRAKAEPPSENLRTV